MRKIGNLTNEQHARRFADYLTAHGIAAQADTARDGSWEVWVIDDAHLQDAPRQFEEFASAPDAPIYVEGSRAAQKLKKKAASENRRSRTRVIDARSQWGVFRDAGVGPFTTAVILLCVGIYILQEMGGRGDALEQLFFITTLQGAASGEVLPEVQRGQIWRLFTPALLHGTILHIIFNMMMLQRLGGSIENIEGSFRFLVMLVVFAVAGNLLQYFTGSWRFLGMSGGVYGLFGFYWICARHDPNRAYVLDKGTVVMMVAWFLLGFTGLVGPIANGAHAGGLIAGILLAMFTIRQVPFTRIRF